MFFSGFLSFQNQPSPRSQNHSSIVSNGLSGSTTSLPTLIQTATIASQQLIAPPSPPHHMDYTTTVSIANHQQPPQSQITSTNLHQKLNVAKALSAVQQAQQQQLLHSALTRAVSQPVGGQQTTVQLLHSISEMLGHKKLERTQSEPLPQLNTSR